MRRESSSRHYGEDSQKCVGNVCRPKDLGIFPTLFANRYSSRFLLVSLNMDAILHESTIHRRRERLGKMIDGLELGDVYGGTIERIKAQNGDKSRLGMAALMWVSHAERSLKADELCHALSVELGSTNFSAGNIPSISTLVGSCQGLITVDKEASTVRLAHFTLQEYFSAHPDIFTRPHSAMAEICLTYLNSQQIKALSTAPSAATENTPFLEYCSVYWGTHAKKELSDCARSLALELLKGHYSQISTELLLAQAKKFPSWRFEFWSPFSGLHCASFFGIVEVVAALVEVGCYGIDEEDFSGRTPLSWAACGGHEGVVKILLELGGVNPDKPDREDRTPLPWAASSGHEEVVKILLGREAVNADKPDREGRTPLSWAASSGHEGVVEILLEREEVNADRPDGGSRTPLLYAAQYGHEGVAKILLEREEVNADEPDRGGQTPLSYAAWHGYEGLVKLLLGQEKVNADKPNILGRTPLSYAAWRGQEGVVKILLGREGVNADKPNWTGRTPLSWAAESGREGVVKILLGREEVNADRPDNGGRTPLYYATKDGHGRVVALLQSHKAVAPSTI